MFESRHRSSSGSSANRWLVVAGAGLVILAFVARMLLDIGHTRVSDLAGVLGSGPKPAPPAAPAPVVVDTPAPVPAETAQLVAASPPVLKHDTTPARAPASKPAPPAPPAASTTAPAAPPSPPAASTDGDYSVQIGAFSSEANAEKLSRRASSLGYQAAVLPQQRGTGTLYLVRVRGLASADLARHAADSMASALGVKAVVLPAGR